MPRDICWLCGGKLVWDADIREVGACGGLRQEVDAGRQL